MTGGCGGIRGARAEYNRELQHLGRRTVHRHAIKENGSNVDNPTKRRRGAVTECIARLLIKFLENSKKNLKRAPFTFGHGVLDADLLVSSKRLTMAKILLVLAAILAVAGAYCPNGCSKNGSCGDNGESCFWFVWLNAASLLFSHPPSPFPFSPKTNAPATSARTATRRGRATIAP